MAALILAAAFALVVFWCYHFVFLMLMEDSLFPGRSDKIIWGVVFICAAPLAPFVFLAWRYAMLAPKGGANER